MHYAKEGAIIPDDHRCPYSFFQAGPISGLLNTFYIRYMWVCSAWQSWVNSCPLLSHSPLKLTQNNFSLTQMLHDSSEKRWFLYSNNPIYFRHVATLTRFPFYLGRREMAVHRKSLYEVQLTDYRIERRDEVRPHPLLTVLCCLPPPLLFPWRDCSICQKESSFTASFS